MSIPAEGTILRWLSVVPVSLKPGSQRAYCYLSICVFYYILCSCALVPRGSADFVLAAASVCARLLLFMNLCTLCARSAADASWTPVLGYTTRCSHALCSGRGIPLLLAAADVKIVLVGLFVCWRRWSPLLVCNQSVTNAYQRRNNHAENTGR
jgi:hypothetical protein